MLWIGFDHRLWNREHLSHADPNTPPSAITCYCLTSEGVGAAREGCDAKRGKEGSEASELYIDATRLAVDAPALDPKQQFLHGHYDMKLEPIMSIFCRILTPGEV